MTKLTKSPDCFAEGAEKVKARVVKTMLEIASDYDEIVLVEQKGNEYLFQISPRKEYSNCSSYPSYKSARRTFARHVKNRSIYPWILEVSRSFKDSKDGRILDCFEGFFTVKVRNFTKEDLQKVLNIKEDPYINLEDLNESMFWRIDLMRRFALHRMERKEEVLSFFQ